MVGDKNCGYLFIYCGKNRQIGGNWRKNLISET